MPLSNSTAIPDFCKNKFNSSNSGSLSDEKESYWVGNRIAIRVNDPSILYLSRTTGKKTLTVFILAEKLTIDFCIHYEMLIEVRLKHCRKNPSHSEPLLIFYEYLYDYQIVCGTAKSCPPSQRRLHQHFLLYISSSC